MAWLGWPLTGLRAIARRWFLPLLIALPILVIGDVLHLNVAQQAAYEHRYSIVEWEAGNFLSKWTHKLTSVLPWNSKSDEERLQEVTDYFRLSGELSSLSLRIEKSIAGDATQESIAELEVTAEEVRSRLSGLQNGVEETIESTISAVLAERGIGFLHSLPGGLILPPVDFRLGGSPSVLVTSPRERIVRLHDVLLRPDISIEQREQVESELAGEANLSALVIDTGGLATYPASVTAGQPLGWTLRSAAHEWLHNYLFFRPLGWNMFDSAEMTSLNETLANIAGAEIGDLALQRLGLPKSVGQPPPMLRAATEGFDFNAAMRETRLDAEELLAQGKVEEAEAYLEGRRQIFVENGYPIRKLNQAYFAFHGTYADTPAAVSPIDDQLRELRGLTADLKTFVDVVSGASSYEEFSILLDQWRVLASAGG